MLNSEPYAILINRMKTTPMIYSEWIMGTSHEGHPPVDPCREDDAPREWTPAWLQVESAILYSDVSMRTPGLTLLCCVISEALSTSGENHSTLCQSLS